MKYLASLLVLVILFSCTPTKEEKGESSEDKSVTNPLIYDNESHFTNMKQLTFGGDNAEAYWSFDNSTLIFQSNNSDWGVSCDQIFYMDPQTDNLANNPPKMVSTGLGRTTCAYFLPGNQTFVYGSTHLGGDACPVEPERVPGRYVWPVYESYDIFTADLEGNIINQLTDFEGYDAEATLSPQGDKIVFTSLRTGDLELFIMNTDGSNVVQVTDQLGYDGGAFFSPDGKKLVFRSSRPQTEKDIKKYKDLLSEGLVEPSDLEIYTVNIDGTDLKQITDLGGANWAPFYHPSGERIIFASNHKSQRGYGFNLFMVDKDGGNLEQITYDEVFDAFPMFSYDGKKLIFSSNRNNGGTHDTNLFLADWAD